MRILGAGTALSLGDIAAVQTVTRVQRVGKVPVRMAAIIVAFPLTGGVVAAAPPGI